MDDTNPVSRLSGYNLQATKTGLNTHVKSLVGLPYRPRVRASWDVSENEFWRYQADALQSMYQFARTRTSFYRDRPQAYPALRWEGRHVLDVLSDLPVLEKKTAKKFNEALWQDSLPLLKKFHTTSGTSGTPLHFPASLRDLSFFQTLRAEYIRRIAGRRRPRMLYLGGAITRESANGKLFCRDLTSEDVHLCIHLLDESRTEAIVEGIAALAPELIWGYPSALFQLARIVGDRLPRIRENCVGFSTAETLQPGWRTVIEQSLCSKVYDFYSSQEAAHAVMECAAGNMHINPQVGVVELLDENDEPVETGERGRVVVSGLNRTTMPLLRYEVGDAAISKGYATDCPCGLAWPMIGRVEGRVEDLARTREGQRIGILGARVLEHVSGFREGQIIQTNFEAFTCRLVLDAEGRQRREPLEEEVRARIADLMGTRVAVDFEYPSKIERGARGKFKAFKVDF